jgi:hypothetical protein
MKNGDRIIQLTKVWFKLPDGFNGTYPDALRELAKYLEEPSGPLPRTTVDMGKDSWGAFLEVLHNGGRMSGMFGMHTYNEKADSLEDDKIVLEAE